MKQRSKQELRQTIGQLLEYAKAQRDFTEGDHEHKRWVHVVTVCYNALNKPTIADLDNLRHEDATKQSHDDLAASGGIVEEP